MSEQQKQSAVPLASELLTSSFKGSKAGMSNHDHAPVSISQTTQYTCWENFPPNLFNTQDVNKAAKQQGPKQVTVSLLSNKRKNTILTQEEKKRFDESILSQSSQSEPSLVIQDNYQISEIAQVLNSNTNTSVLQLSSQQTSNDNEQQQQEVSQRKTSMADCDEDVNCEEIQNEEEKVARAQINQKLIKNKNQFMDFALTAGSSSSTSKQEFQIRRNKDEIHTVLRQQDPYVMIMDKRSRSETPDKMSATEVLIRAHQKLQMRRKEESPSKLLENLKQKQKKAEEVRSQIENSKKKWYEKIRLRQQVAKQKWKELLAERKRALYDKLAEAEERRETEIEILRNKAKQEIEKVDETNYIVKMTVNNMKLDINNKMSETQERRNQIMEENKRKHHDRHMKEEAAEKRRQDLLKEQANKITKMKQKREEAQMRRKQLLEQKRRAAQEYQKRIKVLQRKNDLDKISDVMSFVNNSEFLWEFLGNENEWQDHIEQDDMIIEFIAKDQVEIQKYKLKRDAELLNKIIVFDEQGNIFAQKRLLPLIKNMSKKRYRPNGGIGSGLTSSSESCEEDLGMGHYQNDLDDIIDAQSPTDGSSGKHANQHQTPTRAKLNIQSKEETKSNECCSDHESLEREDSVADECVMRENSENKSGAFMRHDMLSSTQNSHQVGNIMSDEAQNYMIYQIRLKMSMKRNILKKCLSEDLTWADFLKNDMNYGISMQKNFGPQARSQYSTPERRAEIASENEKEEETGDNLLLAHEDIPSTSRTTKDRNNHKRGGRRRHQGSARSKKMKSSGKNNHSSQNSFHSTQPILNMNQGSQGQNNSGHNISDIQQRISSVVYPSTKKKNPKNEKNINISGVQFNSTDANQSITSLSGLLRQKGGSNTSSTHSLLLLHQNPAETPRDGVIINLGNLSMTGRRSLVLETDSGRKKQGSTVRQNSSFSGTQDVIPQNIFNTHLSNQNMVSSALNTSSALDQEDKVFFENQSMMAHTGAQMITYQKPVPALSKIIPKKLTPNATKLLFPICQQKLLLKRPGKDGQFGKFKVNIRIDELAINQKIVSDPKSNLASSGNAQLGSAIANASSGINEQRAEKLDDLIQDFEVVKEPASKSQGSTPIGQARRKESTDTNNSNKIGEMEENVQSPHENIQSQTSQSQPSKLVQVQQKFLENLKANLSTQGVVPYMYDVSQNLQKKKNALTEMISSQPIQQINSDITFSPNKEASMLKPPSKFTLEEQQNQLNLDLQAQSTQNQDHQYKDMMIKYLVIDNIQHLKFEDAQKTIFLEQEESNKLVDYLEANEIQVRYCRLCESIIPDTQTNEAHVQSKSHKKLRDDLMIKDLEDYQLSILVIHSAPGDIEKELTKEKEKALKRKVKRIKQQMIAQAVNHETAAICPGKDFISVNKKRCQILCIDLEKQVIPIIKDYDALEITLKEIIKILDMRKQADLHLMRKLKFIPILIEICKRIQVCHKNEFKHLGKALDYVIKIINILCGLRENRNYMLQTNRMSALIELLNWCLNRPTQLFYGINFIPQLFHILTLHVKHRTPYECQQMKELFIDYLISSQITAKIKSKFQIINGPLDLSEMMGQVPLFLLKSANFLEALTNLISMDAINRPVYEKTDKIGDHVFFVIQNTEIFGIVQMITTILLSRNQDFKPSLSTQASHLQKLLPQTLLSLAITSIKILNHVFRMDYRFTQQILLDFDEQLYHLFNYILYYTVDTAGGEKQEDSKELLHETIVMIGYYCLHNEKNQAVLCKGESTIIQKLCGLPIAYFHDKKMKEILFPTLIQASYKNDRCLAIMDQDIDMQMLVNFINANVKEELPRIIEEENDYQSMSSRHSALERRSRRRSPSMSSTNSSQCSLQIDMINGNSPCVPLVMRFPKKLWKDAIAFYSKVLY